MSNRTFFASQRAPAEFLKETERELGHPVKVVSDGEAETADVVVCVRVGTPSPFTDNLTGHCLHCGHEVLYRPYTPKKPPKICINCLPAFEAEHDAAEARAKR